MALIKLNTNSLSDDAVTIDKIVNDGNLGNRNLIINGAMQVAQRGTSSTDIGASAGYFTVDRFEISTGSTAGRLTMTQESVTDLPGFSKAIKLDCTTADTSVAAGEYTAIAYKNEGQNVQVLQKGTSSAKSVTISFYAKGTAKTYMLELLDNENSRHNTQQFTVSTSWTRHSITFAPDTSGTLTSDNANRFSFFFWVHAGSTFTSGTYTANTWASTTSANRAVGIGSLFSSTDNELFITGVQLEVGETATPFEHRSFGDELAKCQRYFAVLQDTTAAYAGAFGYCNSTTKTKVCFPLGVALRANPTVNVTAATIDIRNNGTNTAAASVSAAIAQGTNLYLDVNAASGLATNHACGIDPKQNMTFDSEL